MAHADIEELAGLALDPADGADSLREHLASCPDCSALLYSLTDASRATGAERLVAAPVSVRQRVLAEAFADAPPVIPVSLSTRIRRRRLPMAAAGLAAAATLVVGFGLGRLTEDGSQAPVEPDSGTVMAATDLTALDSDDPRGSARAVRTDDRVQLRVRAARLGDEPGTHEVWLINLDGKRMVSLGILAAGDAGEFGVPAGLIEEGYRIVDISVEPDDGDPLHSGVSLARGELA